MSRPCAYCNEMGHHIRYCRELANKNRRQAMKTTAPPPPPPHKRVEQKKEIKPTPVRIRTSIYANLYLPSDDETEEGEFSGETEKTPLDIDEEYPEYLHEPSAAWIKYQGWSWVDIEYDGE